MIDARRRGAPAVLVAAMLLGGCSHATPEREDADAAVVVPIKGSPLKQVTLSPDAARRLGIRLAPVSTGAGTLQVPYGAVLYDPQGAAWTFVARRPRVFVRHPITVDRVEGDTAILSTGPPAGTNVVIVGSAQLYGAETGLGDSE
jgi:hypothetical protein